MAGLLGIYIWRRQLNAPIWKNHPLSSTCITGKFPNNIVYLLNMIFIFVKVAWPNMCQECKKMQDLLMVNMCLIPNARFWTMHCGASDSWFKFPWLRIFFLSTENIGVCFFFSFPNLLISFAIFSISEARAIYVGYFPSSRTIFVVVVNPFQNKELSVQVLERLFREACQALSIEVPISREEISFRVSFLFHHVFMLLSSTYYHLWCMHASR